MRPGADCTGSMQKCNMLIKSSLSKIRRLCLLIVPRLLQDVLSAPNPLLVVNGKVVFAAS